jgi:hypothetical protein
MICIGNLDKNLYNFVISVAKLKNLVIFALCRPVLFFNGDFCMNLYSVDSDEAMKR